MLSSNLYHQNSLDRFLRDHLVRFSKEEITLHSKFEDCRNALFNF